MRTRFVPAVAHAALAALAVLTVLAPPARAEAQDATKIGGGRAAIVQVGQPHRVPTALDSVPHPWPGVALGLSALGAALPVVIVTTSHPHNQSREYFYGAMVAEIVTPAAGHLYAGLRQRALIGMATRTIGVGIAAAAGYTSWSSSDFTSGDIAVAFGATMVAVSAVWDVMMVPGDVEKRNQEWLDTHASLELRSLPSGRAPALAMTVRF